MVKNAYKRFLYQYQKLLFKKSQLYQGFIACDKIVTFSFLYKRHIAGDVIRKEVPTK